jgi:NADH-quinone oxidoreductase subunit L
LIFMTFYGETRADHETFLHAHESPHTMLVPLGVLALGSVVAGALAANFFIGHGEAEFWGSSLFRAEGNHVLEEMHAIPAWVGFAPTIAMLSGLAIAWLYYIRAPWLPAATARAFKPLYLFLLNKWYFDELYDWLFVRPAFAIGRFFWKGGDGAVIDGAIDGTAAGVGRVTGRVVKLQTGFMYHYAFAMLIGVAALLTWLMYGGGLMGGNLPWGGAGK